MSSLVGDTLDLGVQWQVGQVEGTGPDLFGEIAGLLVDRLGRLHVVDGTAAEVRVLGVPRVVKAVLVQAGR
jgi:hypothetical protein